MPIAPDTAAAAGAAGAAGPVRSGRASGVRQVLSCRTSQGLYYASVHFECRQYKVKRILCWYKTVAGVYCSGRKGKVCAAYDHLSKNDARRNQGSSESSRKCILFTDFKLFVIQINILYLQCSLNFWKHRCGFSQAINCCDEGVHIKGHKALSRLRAEDGEARTGQQQATVGNCTVDRACLEQRPRRGRPHLPGPSPVLLRGHSKTQPAASTMPPGRVTQIC